MNIPKKRLVYSIVSTSKPKKPINQLLILVQVLRIDGLIKHINREIEQKNTIFLLFNSNNTKGITTNKKQKPNKKNHTQS